MLKLRSKITATKMSLDYFLFVVLAFLVTGAQCEVTEVFAEEGSQAVLPCEYRTLSVNSPAILWIKANRGTVWRKQKSGLQHWGSSWLTEGTPRVRCPHDQFEKGDYSLQIFTVREEDAGIYSCRVENEKHVAESVIMLRIIRVSIFPSVATLEKDVSISCVVTPLPFGATQRWTVNNSPFVPRTRINSDGNKNVREKATARLAGNWTCVVEYRGTVGRASAALTVRGIIQPSTDNTKVFAAVGSAVTLPCVFSPGLIPSSPAWEKLKPGSFFQPTPQPLPVSFSPSSPSSRPSSDNSATLTEVGFEDEGLYRCSGIVGGQRLTRNMQLVVAKIESSIPSKKSGSVTLTCQLSDTSQVTHYEWAHVVYDPNGTQSVGPVQKGQTLRISKVSEENQGQWACRFYGKQGILGNVTYHIQTMGGLSGQKSPGVSNNTGVVVGLSFLLFVLLLVLVKMYKNHQRRRTAFQYPALETIVHTTANEREARDRNREKM